jgi:organic radical activating enzyme
MMTTAKIDRYDLLNNPGDDKPSVTVWFTGCSMNCPGCHNVSLHTKTQSQENEKNTILFAICEQCDKQHIDTVVFLGGEPMEQPYEELLWLSAKLSSYGYKIWLYTGWEFEDIPETIKHCMYTIKCGKYDENLKQDGFPASSNQRVFRKTNNVWNQIKL